MGLHCLRKNFAMNMNMINVTKVPRIACCKHFGPDIEDIDQMSMFSPSNAQINPFNEFDNATSQLNKNKGTKSDYEPSMYLVDEWEAHSGPILKVIFAHPQYGQVFASCTESSEVFIWEEKIIRKPGTSHSLYKQWSKVAELKVSKDKIQDIKFSPEHCGLKLLVLYK